jgi:hypothetical protein
LQRALDGRALVSVLEDFGDGPGRGFLRDAASDEFAHDAEAAAALYFDRCLRLRARDLGVVQATRFQKMFDGGVDLIGRMISITEASTKLRDGESPSREHVQRVQVGGWHENPA